MASANGRVEGVLVRGMRMEDILANKTITSNVVAGDLKSIVPGTNRIAIGSRLAEALGVFPGSEISLISPEGRSTVVGTVPRIVSYTVGAVFEVGINDYDKIFVLMPMQDAQTLLLMGDQVGMVEIQTTNPDKVRDILAPLQPQLQGKGIVVDWQQMNSALFEALEIERVAMFVVLSLIYSRLALGGLAQASAVVGFSIVISMLFLYATGCYRRDALLNRTAALSRIPTALAISSLVLFLYLHYLFPVLFPSARVFLSISRCVTIILVGTGISLGAAIISRNVVRILLHNDVFRRRILVVGTGQRARHIEDLSRAHGSLQEIHFVSEDVLTQSGAAGAADGKAAIPSIGELADRLDADEIVVAVDDRNRVALDSLLPCKARGVPVTEFNSFVERQTGRIELGVTTGAGARLGVHRQQLPNRLGAAYVRLHRGNTRRRRRGRFTQDAVHDPRAAQHRRRRGAVGRHFQNRALRQQASQRAPLRHRDPPHRRSVNRLEFIVPCQSFIDVKEVGIHQIADRKVVAHHGSEEGQRLAFHRIDQVLVQLVFGIQALIRIVPAEMA